MLNKIIKKLEDAKEYFGSPMITIDDAIKIIKQHESEFEDAIKKAYDDGFELSLSAQDYYNKNYKNE